MNIKIYIVLCFLILTNSTFGQNIRFKYNPSFITEKKIITDTIAWRYTDTLNQEHVDYYPINSDILFISNHDTTILESTSIKRINDTLILTIARISFGLQIKVIIKIDNQQNCYGKIFYWTAIHGNETELKIKTGDLEFNEKELVKGDNVMGKIYLNFIGTIPDDIIEISDEKNSDKSSSVNIEKFGQIKGKINVIIE